MQPPSTQGLLNLMVESAESPVSVFVVSADGKPVSVHMKQDTAIVFVRQRYGYLPLWKSRGYWEIVIQPFEGTGLRYTVEIQQLDLLP